MKVLFCLLMFMLTFACHSQSVKKIHSKAVVVDGHNDVLSSSVLKGIDISRRITEGHSDLDRWKDGGLDVQFFFRVYRREAEKC